MWWYIIILICCIFQSICIRTRIFTPYRLDASHLGHLQNRLHFGFQLRRILFPALSSSTLLDLWGFDSPLNPNLGIKANQQDRFSEFINSLLSRSIRCLSLFSLRVFGFLVLSGSFRSVPPVPASIEFHRTLEPHCCSFPSMDARPERFGFAACWSCWFRWRSWHSEFYRTVILTDWCALRTEDCAIRGMNSLCRSVLAKGESVLLTLCSGFGLLVALLTTKEYDLYSKDFDELNAQTEERINQILQHTIV